ncbi:MSP domain protein [Necator americanus]|uniref:MSP domain protein n=1 Tax=Necator americanus TaxID=51031 RepID=W2TJD8_NECAM|nr:MSP domain protein [Necator americanus]ETN81261.1 MSP domain protein [Necator americanus]
MLSDTQMEQFRHRKGKWRTFEKKKGMQVPNQSEKQPRLGAYCDQQPTNNMSIELKKSTNSEKTRLITGRATHRPGQEPMIARLAIKITCSDNSLYRVTPVYAIVEPEEVIVLNIGRIEGVAKKDRLGILMIDYSGTGNAKDAFKVLTTPITHHYTLLQRSDLRPATINIPLLVKES